MIIEIWTLASVVGAIFGIWNLRDAWHDLGAAVEPRMEISYRGRDGHRHFRREAWLHWAWRLLTEKGNGDKMLTRGHVRRESLRLWVQLVFSIVVIPALLAPRLPVTSPLAYLFLTAAVALLISSVTDRRERLRLRAIMHRNG